MSNNPGRTHDPSRMARRLRKKADGSTELAEFQAPLIEGVKGMDPGFLFGTGFWGNETWEVIIHQEQDGGGEYSVRQAGRDEDTGLIIRVPKANAAKIIMEHGEVFSRAKPLPDNADDGKVICAQHAQTTYMIGLTAFIEHVMAMAEIQIEPDDLPPENP